MPHFRKHSSVEWKWAGNTIHGIVEDIFTDSVTKTIKGKKITRHGSDEKPAYLVKSDAGNKALKLETELKAATKKKTTAKSKIKMFS